MVDAADPVATDPAGEPVASPPAAAPPTEGRGESAVASLADEPRHQPGPVGLDQMAALDHTQGPVDLGQQPGDRCLPGAEVPGEDQVAALIDDGEVPLPLATRAARELLLRRLFVSAAALDPLHGTSENTLEDAEVKLAMADVAAEVVVAVDASKLGHRATARGLAPDQVALLVTDLDPADPRLDPYRDAWDIR